MKKLFPLLFVVIMLATGCPQPEPEVYQVEIGLFTPYNVFPEILNGKIKAVVEKNYWAVEEDGKFVKGDRLSVAARDTFSWTNDFKVTFDENGNLLKCVYLDENDEVIGINRFNIENDRTVSGEYLKNDTVLIVVKMIYNDEGTLTNIERFRMPEDTLINKWMFIQDENGNVVEWRFYNTKDEPTYKYLFTVNQEARRTNFKFYNPEGILSFEQIFTYNEKGFLSRQVIIDSDGTEYISEYDYEYDDNGNWIKAVTGLNEQPIIEEREITYYED